MRMYGCLTLALFCAAALEAGVCQTQPLSVYQAEGFSCTNGHLTFSNFTFSSSGTGSPLPTLDTPNQILVKPATGGFTFSQVNGTPFSVPASSTATYNIGYHIAIDPAVDAGASAGMDPPQGNVMIDQYYCTDSTLFSGDGIRCSSGDSRPPVQHLHIQTNPTGTPGFCTNPDGSNPCFEYLTFTQPATSFANVLTVIFLDGFLPDGVTPIASGFDTVTGTSYVETGSTLGPTNTTGDLNPRGVAIVPQIIGNHTSGSLVKGNILVSYFNNSSNLPGTGTTIVQFSPSGTSSVFATVPACPGLTSALVALSSGFVVVGSLPTTDGTSATAGAGCVTVLRSDGTVAATLSGVGINGPWDMTALDLGFSATLFVTNVLDGTVERILLSTPPGGNPTELARTTIGSGFTHQTDTAALEIGPTGLAVSFNGQLLVTDPLNNRIAAIPNAWSRNDNAGNGITFSQNGLLKRPLGLARATNGHLLTANGGDGGMVELAPDGTQVAITPLGVTSQGTGAVYGLDISLLANGNAVYYVNDFNNTLNLLLPYVYTH